VKYAVQWRKVPKADKEQNDDYSFPYLFALIFIFGVE
jgi:hypothetical protein